MRNAGRGPGDSSTLRLLQVLLSPRIGGAEALARDLGAALERRGVVVATAYLDPPGSTGSRTTRLRRLRRELRGFRPTAVVAHSALPNLYARVAAPRGIPVVTVLHSAGDDFVFLSLRLAERLLRRRTAAVVAVSPAQARRYDARFGAGRVARIIPNGIPADVPRRLPGGPAQPPSIVTVARVAVQKDPDLWLDVVRGFGAERADFAWWGPQDDEALAARLSAALAGSAASAVLAGPTAQPLAVLTAADVLFHPSSLEAHSIALLEAAAVGIPVVCAEAVDASYAGGIAAATFPGGDAAAARAALDAVLADYPSVSAEAARRAVDVRSDHSIERVADEYVDLLRTALSPRPRRRP